MKITTEQAKEFIKENSSDFHMYGESELELYSTWMKKFAQQQVNKAIEDYKERLRVEFMEFLFDAIEQGFDCTDYYNGINELLKEFKIF